MSTSGEQRRARRPEPPVPVATPAPIELPREVCTALPARLAAGVAAHQRHRWLRHGHRGRLEHPPLPRAAGGEPPSSRGSGVVTLARLEETALTAREHGAALGQPVPEHALPGRVHPAGPLLPRRWVRCGPGRSAAWRWSGGCCSSRGSRRCCVRYASSGPLRLRLEPLLAFRDYHALTHRNPERGPASRSARWGTAAWCASSRTRGLPSLRLAHRGGPFSRRAQWHENVEYLEELDRGLDFREDLLLPGSFELELAPGQPAAPGGDGRDRGLARPRRPGVGSSAAGGSHPRPVASRAARRRRRPRRCARPARASRRCLPRCAARIARPPSSPATPGSPTGAGTR